MQTTKVYQTIGKILLFSGIFFTTVCFVDTWRMPFFLNADYKLIKFILCAVLPFALTALYYAVSRDFIFIGRACAVNMALFIAFYIIDSVSINWIACYGSFMIILHLAYALVSVFSVFICCVLICLVQKRKGQTAEEFKKFYNDYFLGFSLMLAFIFILIYFVIRDYQSSEYIVNLIPFKGELYDFIFRPFNTLTAVRTVGNVLFYSAMSLCVIRFCKNKKYLFAVFIPACVSILCEATQYLFKCGDCDIDDVIMNIVGALIGAGIYKLFIQKLVKN